MRGFSQPHHKDITLHRGAEQITLRIHPLPLLFLSRLDVEFPGPPDADAVGSRIYRVQRAILAAGVALRDEQLPQPPEQGSPETWAAHVEALRAAFDAAGLSLHHINAITLEALQLREESPLEEEAGNSSAPGAAPSAT